MSKIFPAQSVYNVTIDWSRFGLLSHSLGANTLLSMIQQNTTFAQVSQKAHLHGGVPQHKVSYLVCCMFSAINVLATLYLLCTPHFRV